jgi:hypothetical protein
MCFDTLLTTHAHIGGSKAVQYALAHIVGTRNAKQDIMLLSLLHMDENIHACL